MSHDDPFTLNLFGNTALSSGLGFGVTAFCDDFGPDDDVDGSTPFLPVAAGPVRKAVSRARESASPAPSINFHLSDSRGLAKGWKQRAKDNLAAIRLTAQIEVEERPATAEEQAQLIKFTGFGASDLANGMFRRPGEVEFRAGWEEIGSELERRRRGRLCLARALHPVCAFHAGIHRPGDLDGIAAPRMAGWSGAGAGHRNRAVSGAHAGRAPRPLSCHWGGARPGHGQDCAIVAAAGAHCHR